MDRKEKRKDSKVNSSLKLNWLKRINKLINNKDKLINI